MKFLLTGKIGIGKTTVCKKIVEIAKKNGLNCCGVLTHRLEDKGKTELIVEDISTGERKPLACQINSENISNGIISCNFIFNREAIEFGKKALSKNGDLLVIDEFGNLELEGKGFTNAISAFKSGENKNSIIVVRSELVKTVSAKLNCNFKIIEVNKDNREEIPINIFKSILTNLYPENVEKVKFSEHS